jgi:hypothetical protein
LSNASNIDRCFYYVIVVTAGILGAIAIAVIIKYDLTLFSFLLVCMTIIIVPLLVIFSRTVTRHQISIRFTFIHTIPCRKGFIKKNDEGNLDICHRCVPFHFSVWPIVLFIVATSATNGKFLWEPFYNYLIVSLGNIGYLILCGILLCAIPLEAVPTIKLKKESKNIARCITSLLTTLGITLILIYVIEYISTLTLIQTSL